MSYSAIVTHDIDLAFKYKSLRNVLGAIKRNNGIINSINEFISSKKNYKSDPYFIMNELLSVNSSFGLKSVFYFMAGKTDSKFDRNNYNINDSNIKVLLNELSSAGATIGLHPSYNSYNNLEVIKSEKSKLEDSLGKEVVHSRQHYLRYDTKTFQLLAEAGLKYDSTIGPRKSIEINNEFNREYEIYRHESTVLIEQPFLMMDTYLLSDPMKMLKDLKKSISILKENKGTARIIWHNNNYHTNEHKEIYREVLKVIAP